ncbi:HAD family hydrolase [Moellerella wisconsensis]|uniref:HAD family hydrolase n=1 Tax=Moellerella wisconsensis TaxID=158849 RepID=UPI0030761E91
MTTKIAVFDLDETLIQGDSSVLWTHYLWDKQIINDPQFIAEDSRMMAQYNAGILDMPAYLAFSMQSLAGIPTEQVDIWLDDFVNTIILPNIYPAARQCIDDYRQRHIPVIIISATVSFIVKKIAAKLHADFAIGIDMQVINNSYSGTINGIASFKTGKVKRLTQWLSQQRVSDAEIVFYTDSANDLPMCYFADQVITINADPRLAEIAMEQQWTQLQWKI